ncbi:MAG: hypothetical protein ACLVES_08280 [Faecalibacterium prausnitzii]
MFRSSFTGASRSTGRWLTCPMDARQKARATVCGRQAQLTRDSPEVEARQHDVLPPPAAVAAACAGKRERLVPRQQRCRAGKIHPSAEVEL